MDILSPVIGFGAELPSNTPFILSLTVDTVSDGNGAWVFVIYMYVNGCLVLSSTDLSLQMEYININPLEIGNWSSQSSSEFSGGISSLLVFNTSLTESERQQIEGFLAWKWWNDGSLILDASHPYYSDPPLFKF